jgi:hypothetical protein
LISFDQLNTRTNFHCLFFFHAGFSVNLKCQKKFTKENSWDFNLKTLHERFSFNIKNLFLKKLYIFYSFNQITQKKEFFIQFYLFYRTIKMILLLSICSLFFLCRIRNHNFKVNALLPFHWMPVFFVLKSWK